MPVPRGTLLLVLIVSGVVALSAIAGASMAVLQPRASWVMFGFESVVTTAAVLGVLIGRGRYADGPALGLLCVAGTILVGSGFGYLGGGRTLFGINLTPFLLARAAAAGLLVLAAAWIVLARDPKATLPPFIRGAAFGAGVPIVLITLWKMRASIGTIPDMAQVAIAIVVFVLVTGLIATSVQLLVKAFDAGVRRADAFAETANARAAS